MDNHSQKEHRIEPRKGAVKPGDESPGDRKEGIARIMHLSRIAIPSAAEQTVSRVRRDKVRVLGLLPRQLRECLAILHRAAFSRAEHVLLAVRRVPYPIHKQIARIQRHERGLRPRVGARRVVCQIYRAVAITQRHTRQIPEYQHEAPFLVVHIPCRANQLFTLAARVRIQPVRHQQEAYFAGDIPVLFVLPCCGAETDEEEDEPWQPHLEEHFEIQPLEHARVELGAHEEVVERVARHAVLGAAVEGAKVCYYADKEAGDDGDGHERAEVVDDGVEFEDASEVQDGYDGDGAVEGPYA